MSAGRGCIGECCVKLIDVHNAAAMIMTVATLQTKMLIQEPRQCVATTAACFLYQYMIKHHTVPLWSGSQFTLSFEHIFLDSVQNFQLVALFFV